MRTPRTLAYALALSAAAAVGTTYANNTAKTSSDTSATTTQAAGETSMATTSSTKHSPMGQRVSDAALTAKVKAKLIGDEQVKARNINVDTSGGVVQLNGQVTTNDEMSKAETLARGVSGVVDVKNNLRVGG